MFGKCLSCTHTCVDVVVPGSGFLGMLILPVRIVSRYCTSYIGNPDRSHCSHAESDMFSAMLHHRQCIDVSAVLGTTCCVMLATEVVAVLQSVSLAFLIFFYIFVLCVCCFVPVLAYHVSKHWLCTPCQ